MLSEELAEAQNSVTRLNALFYIDGDENPDSIPQEAYQYGAMLVGQFEDCFNAYLEMAEEYDDTGEFDRESADHLHDFVNDNLQYLQLKSLVYLAELCAVLKAQPKQIGDGVKSVFALTDLNQQTLTSLRTFVKSKIHTIRLELSTDETSGDSKTYSPDGRVCTIESNDMTSELWGDLDWANTLLENPSHPIHMEFSKNDGFHIGPALEKSIVSTREHVEFFSSF